MYRRFATHMSSQMRFRALCSHGRGSSCTVRCIFTAFKSLNARHSAIFDASATTLLNLLSSFPSKIDARHAYGDMPQSLRAFAIHLGVRVSIAIGMTETCSFSYCFCVAPVYRERCRAYSASGTKRAYHSCSTLLRVKMALESPRVLKSLAVVVHLVVH